MHTSEMVATLNTDDSESGDNNDDSLKGEASPHSSYAHYLDGSNS